MTWIISNLSTIIICLILIAAVTAIIVCMVRRKIEGKSSCGCGCSACPMGSSCKQKK